MSQPFCGKRRLRDKATAELFGAELSGGVEGHAPGGDIQGIGQPAAETSKVPNTQTGRPLSRYQARPAQLSRDQAARDYANSAWESDAANFDAI